MSTVAEWVKAANEQQAAARTAAAAAADAAAALLLKPSPRTDAAPAAAAAAAATPAVPAVRIERSDSAGRLPALAADEVPPPTSLPAPAAAAGARIPSRRRVLRTASDSKVAADAAKLSKAQAAAALQLVSSSSPGTMGGVMDAAQRLQAAGSGGLAIATRKAASACHSPRVPEPDTPMCTTPGPAQLAGGSQRPSLDLLEPPGAVDQLAGGLAMPRVGEERPSW
jgi:hypothetical protein